MSEKIKPGSFVSLTYVISDTDGNILEQTDIPVGYVYGGDMELLGGMDRALRGKQVGDRVEFDVPPDQGFGPHDPDLTFTDDLENVPDEFRFLGAEVQMQNDRGEIKSFFVTRIENGQLTLDGNHPLAGRNLRVSLEVKEVRKATAEDLQTANQRQERLN
jgi:FKBP-type peptidyl-prolyl cis-trans isomerase SlyD